MSMQRVFAAVQQGVLSHVRLSAIGGIAAAATAPVLLRGFADASYLNKDDVTSRVLEVVKNFDKVDAAKVTPAAAFQKDLGLDSLDAVELVMALEEEFAIEIPDSEADKIASTADAIAYVAANPMAK